MFTKVKHTIVDVVNFFFFIRFFFFFVRCLVNIYGTSLGCFEDGGVRPSRFLCEMRTCVFLLTSVEREQGRCCLENDCRSSLYRKR